MEAIIARIKGYVTKLYPKIMSDIEIDDGFLDFMVRDVVDRVLAITKRKQLVFDYEQDLVDYPDPTDDFWDYYKDYPIPSELERVLARTVIRSIKTIKEQNIAENNDISSLSDNGQSVTYRDRLSNFFNSSDDAEVFSGDMKIINTYRLVTVVGCLNRRSRIYGNTSLI
jgi:hypothetical protein